MNCIFIFFLPLNTDATLFWLFFNNKSTIFKRLFYCELTKLSAVQLQDSLGDKLYVILNIYVLQLKLSLSSADRLFLQHSSISRTDRRTETTLKRHHFVL